MMVWLVCCFFISCFALPCFGDHPYSHMCWNPLQAESESFAKRGVIRFPKSGDWGGSIVEIEDNEILGWDQGQVIHFPSIWSKLKEASKRILGPSNNYLPGTWLASRPDLPGPLFIFPDMESSLSKHSQEHCYHVLSVGECTGNAVTFEAPNEHLKIIVVEQAGPKDQLSIYKEVCSSPLLLLREHLFLVVKCLHFIREQ